MTNVEIAEKIGLKKTERPGREITLDPTVTGNNNISLKVGTVDDKNQPSTIYICVSFWIGISENGSGDEFGRIISSEFKKELYSIYKKDLKNILQKSQYFPFQEDNIYICDYPENIAYNNKRCFTSIELNLHTVNCLHNRERNYPFKNTGDTELFDETIKVAKKMASSKLLIGKTKFSIHKRKKDR